MIFSWCVKIHLIYICLFVTLTVVDHLIKNYSQPERQVKSLEHTFGLYQITLSLLVEYRNGNAMILDI